MLVKCRQRKASWGRAVQQEQSQGSVFGVHQMQTEADRHGPSWSFPGFTHTLVTTWKLLVDGRPMRHCP